jgi:hypothetical protein
MPTLIRRSLGPREVGVPWPSSSRATHGASARSPRARWPRFLGPSDRQRRPALFRREHPAEAQSPDAVTSQARSRGSRSRILRVRLGGVALSFKSGRTAGQPRSFADQSLSPSVIRAACYTRFVSAAKRRVTMRASDEGWCLRQGRGPDSADYAYVTARILVRYLPAGN